jgi:hypothetical protein
MPRTQGFDRRPFAVLLSLIAIVALVAALTAGEAGAASGSGNAVAAKKKCKKPKKRAAGAAKKKKCKKKKHVVLPSPIVRMTVSWTGGNPTSIVDLHSYDAAGLHDGWVFLPSEHIEQNIPNTSYSNADGASGTETFTDNIFVRGSFANRQFSFVVCNGDNLPVHWVGISADGTVTTGDASDSQFSLAVPGGPATPATAC